MFRNLLLIMMALAIFCKEKSHSNEDIGNKELMIIINSLLDGMNEYMQSGNASYTIKDVEETKRILIVHYNQVKFAKSRKEANIITRNTVEELNRLNERTEYSLIETSQRELICEFIIKSGVFFGFNKPNEDITEEWRKW
ncbi:hypothetical protein [Leptospira wolffii]|uniref:hypothetical protein n=1 Tax=Leptospira wolffii TaxID=409998 RepID=UPI00058BEF04|nr:hypothetical protein [Leptospira wolffii]